ncbi:hypothetical protein ABZ897_28430 [Nonomuraea sp. NPDC046802]|uniref:hypothetical protein n=1 Tax=Nonomuraea sp. NPDC046802 TaxID=3154919 RepID=UPI0033EC11D1
MPEPRPIKEGCLQGGNPNAYGGREQIRGLVMGTRPEEFGPVADAYKQTSRLLTDTIEELGEAAGRLVADGNWGGGSARAMLTRMNRIQSYLQALRGGVDGVPPSLENVSRELASAKERFDQATEQRTRNVYAMGSGGEIPVNNADEDARQFMVRLNGVFHNAHAGLPDRLPWDAALASPAPYLPPDGPAPTPPVRGGDLPFEDTVPVRATTDLAASPGYQATSAGPLPGASTTPGAIAPAHAPAPPVTTAPPVGVPTLPSAGRPPGTTSTASAPNAQQPNGGPVNAQQPNARQPIGPVHTPPPGVPTPPQGRSPIGQDAPPDSRRDPSTTAQQARASESGPSVRAGSVPVVDASWPASGPAPAGAERAATGGAGMPFMPMGAMAGQESQTSRRTGNARGGDDDFFRPAVDCGPPVVG